MDKNKKTINFNEYVKIQVNRYLEEKMVLRKLHLRVIKNESPKK